jgi:hypothetical protein
MNIHLPFLGGFDTLPNMHLSISYYFFCGFRTSQTSSICHYPVRQCGWIPAFGGMMSPWVGGKLNHKFHLQNPPKKPGIFMGSITRSWGFINPATGHPVKNRWFRFALIIVFCWTLKHFWGGHLTGGWMNHHS